MTNKIKSFFNKYRNKDRNYFHTVKCYYLKNEIPYILLKFKEVKRPFKFIIDTGSEITLINKRTIIQNPILQDTTIKRFLAINTVAGKTKPCPIVALNFKINNVNYDNDFLISNNNFHNFDGLIGVDFLKKHKTLINWSKKELILNK